MPSYKPPSLTNGAEHFDGAGHYSFRKKGSRMHFSLVKNHALVLFVFIFWSGISYAYGESAVETKHFENTGFTHIEVRDGLKFSIEIGPSYSVVATTSKRKGDWSPFSDLVVRQWGEKLIIRRPLGTWKQGRQQYDVHITTPQLDQATISGGGINVVHDTFGEVSAENIQTFELSVKKATLRLAGSCEKISLQAESAKIEGDEFICEEAAVEIHSRSEISLHLKRTITGEINGDSKVSLLGNPDTAELNVRNSKLIIYSDTRK
ncbi:MAG: DUF2807 domain-containing protein [Parvularculaceae bacterium]